MKQEDKDLLLKDLSARLPYGVKVQTTYINPQTKERKDIGTDVLSTIEISLLIDGSYEPKPYLFPLSSMTEEQIRKFYRIKGLNLSEEELIQFNSNNLSVVSNITTYNWSVDFLNKNHFDYRGLIDKGLAIDATNLNIY